MRGCSGGGVEGVVGGTLVSQVFPCVVQRVLSSDDTAMLQVSSSFLTFNC